jgi:hypothetical protein
MKLEFNGPKMQIWTISEERQEYGISVKETKYMYFLNRLTRKYRKSTKFKVGDHPYFRVTSDQLEHIASRNASARKHLVLAGWGKV